MEGLAEEWEGLERTREGLAEEWEGLEVTGVLRFVLQRNYTSRNI